MNKKNKINSTHKKILKDSILKFSNKVLFERRERIYNSYQSTKNSLKKKIINRTTKNFRKNKTKPKEQYLLPFYKTMSSFYQTGKSYNILPLLEYFEKNIIPKKKIKEQYRNRNELFCKTDRNFRDKDFFMTDISTLKTSKNRKNNQIQFNSEKINMTDRNEKIRKDSNIAVLLLIQSSRNQDSKDNNINSKLNKEKTKYKDYSFIKTEQNKNYWDRITSEEYAKNVLDAKLSQYDKSVSYRDYLNKLNEQKIYNYTSRAKTERLRRLEEAYQSQVEFYKDSIISFQKSKKLLENDFSNKITDYTKYISTKKEREKIKESSIRQQIMDYRKDIEQIKTKINKIELEKKNIIKWIFLQIQMKEKKLKLPEYYKSIIMDYNKNKSSKRLLYKNDEKNDSSFFDKKKLNKKVILKLKDSFAIDDKIVKNRELFNSNNNGSTDKYIRVEEYKRILNYKNNLIYKTPEELKDRLISLEKGNLVLLQYKDILHSQLFKYKKELESFMKERSNFENENRKIGGWEKELNNIKNIADKNKKIASVIKNKKLSNLKKNLDNNNEKSGHFKIKNNYINDTDKYKLKNMSLYKNIYNIFEICQKVGSNLSYCSEIIHLVKRKINTKEKEMLLMLEFIELTVDYLIMSINKKKNQGQEIKALVKNIKANIDKEHKLEKAKMQIILDMKKINSLEEKVEKRYNKINFLPNRKKNFTEFKFNKKEKNNNKNINKKHQIQDYLYNDESSKEP